MQQPPVNDSKCEGDGLASFENDAFMDPAFYVNPNLPQRPTYFASVSKPLPKCLSIRVDKSVSANVLAGQPMTFTVSIHNVGNNDTPPNTINLLDVGTIGFHRYELDLQSRVRLRVFHL